MREIALIDASCEANGHPTECTEPAPGTVVSDSSTGITVTAGGTTKECAVCGVETAKPIWVREHSCPACGHTEDRDLNAAKNILYRGLKQVGAGRSESTSPEIEDFWCANESLRDSSTPVQTALPTLTPQREEVGAKRVVEAGSPVA